MLSIPGARFRVLYNQTGLTSAGKYYYEKIVFSSICSGNYEIYTMTPDSSDQQQISSGDCDSHMPGWPGYLIK